MRGLRVCAGILPPQARARTCTPNSAKARLVHSPVHIPEQERLSRGTGPWSRTLPSPSHGRRGQFVTYPHCEINCGGGDRRMSRSVGHTCSPDEAELEYANLTGARAGGLESQHARPIGGGRPRRRAGLPPVSRAFRSGSTSDARRYPTGPFLLHETVMVTPGATSIVQPWAADPGAASFGVCVCRSVCPSSESKSFRPLNAQIDACPLVTAAVLFDASPMPPATGGPLYGGPLISPAKAPEAPTPNTATAHAATPYKRNFPI